MATMMFYERATALSRERHQKLKVAPQANDFGFARHTNSVLLAGSEFAEAGRDHPIVFIGQEGGPFTAAALVGLADSENLLVDAAGKWAEGSYVPAFIRRYPFVLASGDDPDQLTVCIDEAYPGWNEEQGEALFGADGNETVYLSRVIDFLKLFHQEMARTAAFAGRLAELGLLVQKVIEIEREGKRRSLEGLWVVDAAKLAALGDAELLALARSGELQWIYSHLHSLANLARLAARLDRPAA